MRTARCSGWTSSHACSTSDGGYPASASGWHGSAVEPAAAVGPIASTALSAYLIWEVRRLGVSTAMLLRMIGNVGLDALISAVPLAGSIDDVFFHANLRNRALLRRHLNKTAPDRRRGGPAG